MSKRPVNAVHVWTQFSASDYRLLEDYRRSLPKIPGVATTVRHLVSLGLKVEMAKKQSATKDKAA